MQLFDFQDITPPFSLPTKEGYSFRKDADSNLYYIDMPNGKILYAPYFFDKKISDTFYKNFLKNKQGLAIEKTDWKSINPFEIEWETIEWRLDAIKMFGKLIPQPRFTAWYGDPKKSYKYSGITMQPKPWNEDLLVIKEAIEKLTNQDFNSVLLNWYRDGQDHMSWHTDDEPELGKNPTIASVNFGASRRFLFRRKDNHDEKLTFMLHHGSLLMMSDEIQHHWQHALPKAAKVKENRINLTFRWII